ncbi:MAG TPA: helix-turn-helix domain-containing protein [Kofleriaceae bacterium]|nr:helix-turn-helix domain-containing protein [Kofleriaceae bacterium]
MRCFHAFEDLHVPATSEHRLYPEHTLSLSFLEGTSWFADPTGTACSLAPVPAVFVDNPTTQPVRLVSLGRTRMVGINFYVWGAIRLFGCMPTNDELSSIVPARLATTIARHLSRGELGAAIDVLEQFIATRARAVDLAPSAAIDVATSLCDSSGHGSILGLAEMTGVSIRQLERQFRQQVGMSPKALARVIRFESARRRIEDAPETSLTEIAYALGYADQAHFSREFRDLAWITPRAFRDEIRRQRSLRGDVAFVQEQKSVAS